MKISTFILMGCAILVVLTAIGGLWLWTAGDSGSTFSGPLEELRLGTDFIPHSALIWIAERQDYFRANGLKVDIRIYEYGAMAVRGLLEGKVDVATTAEFVPVRHIVDGRSLKILAAIDRVDDMKLIARRDRGISQIKDLSGKRIGVFFASAAEFFLDRFLTFNSLTLQEIQRFNLSESKPEEIIVAGDIDAAMVWEPHANNVEEALGANAVAWPGQSGLSYFWLAVSKAEIVEKRPEAMKRFLEALLEAEDFLKSHEKEAVNIVARRLGADTAYLNKIWKNHRFEVTLNRSLVTTMENQSEWIMERAGKKNGTIPNFVKSMHFDALESLRPEAISIIH